VGQIEPFHVCWPEAEIAHVLDRVRDYRFPPAPPVGGWSYGCDAALLAAVRNHWLARYDWRAAEQNLNRYPQFTARVEEMDIHFLHILGEASEPRPLLITHGWPSTPFEFLRIVELLAFPSRSGGARGDAFDLVIPSLPGFAYTPAPPRPIGPRGTAALWRKLMTETLGYPRFLAHGGDFGSVVTSWLGADHGDVTQAIHLTMIPFAPKDGAKTDAEASRLKASRNRTRELAGYMALQASKPQSLAYAMSDNPMAQAAWIIERLHDWSDLRTRAFGDLYTLDDLVTAAMLYVMPNAFASAAWYYRIQTEENAPLRTRCETPTACANFHGEPLYLPPPRSWAERAYNVVRWADFEQGGHFPAVEAPQALVQDLRAWASQCADA
jgi:pimeloyl-ACP methyl ester carboxylesterase